MIRLLIQYIPNYRSIGLGICIGTAVSLFGSFITDLYLVSRMNDDGETWEDRQRRHQEAYRQEQTERRMQIDSSQRVNENNINNQVWTAGYGQQPSDNPAFINEAGTLGNVLKTQYSILFILILPTSLH